MGKEEADRHRADVGKALKIAAGLTMAGLGVLGAKHVNTKNKRLRGAERRLQSAQETITHLQEVLSAELNEKTAAQRQAGSLHSRLKSAASLQNNLQKDLTSADAECVRLAGLLQQEGAARTAADTLSLQLREQLSDLQNRLDASVAAESAARRKLRVYKQQIKRKALLQRKLRYMEKLYDATAAESCRLGAVVTDEKTARAHVEQACSQLGLQLVDLQRRLRASETREADATTELAASKEQTEAAKRELCAEKDNHSITAARGKREMEAYSLALQEAAAVLNQHKLESERPLAEAHAVLHNGAERVVYPRRVSSAPHQHPTCEPCKAMENTWQVAELASPDFEAKVTARHCHQKPFDLVLADFCSNSGCKGVYRTFRDASLGLVGEGGSSKVYYLERQSSAGWQPVTFKVYTPDKVHLGKQEHQGLLAARGVPHIAQLVEAFTFCEASASEGSLIIITEYAEGRDLYTLVSQLSHEPGWEQRKMPLMKTVMLQIFEAIKHMHGRGWCHGDLNATNILVKLGSDLSDAKATVIDLGGSLPAKMGRGTICMMSELYSSPEVKGKFNGQCKQGLQPRPDMLSQDIWAMGCLIVMIMTGKDAFDFPESSQYSNGALAREVDKKHSHWAFKHELYSQPMVCWEAPFCKIARKAASCERYDSCWQLVWQMLHPVQHCRAQIDDVITSKFMLMD